MLARLPARYTARCLRNTELAATSTISTGAPDVSSTAPQPTPTKPVSLHSNTGPENQGPMDSGFVRPLLVAATGISLEGVTLILGRQIGHRGDRQMPEGSPAP